MEILTRVRRLYISFKSLVNDFMYSFGRAALLLLVEVQNHTVPVWERRRIRVNVPHVNRTLQINYHNYLNYTTCVFSPTSLQTISTQILATLVSMYQSRIMYKYYVLTCSSREPSETTIRMQNLQPTSQRATTYTSSMQEYGTDTYINPVG